MQQSLTVKFTQSVIIDKFESRYIFEDTSPEEIEEIKREGIYFYDRMVEIAKNKGNLT